ncbi:hypothetical protein BTA35_0202295 [Oceanospirillum linum]|uniref:Uncharacterized protein n=2 Tax=Oceanospirillum linum TaxID=966 RepID=A0A1T1HEX1_OCELI|nr:hypothetical protein BTA35_0202295 [Oceanospirillum linum]SEF53608.1 hypothetical protein SAMN04489856_101470 [Oleiphilus messinensis]SMP04717.1 hypothetical protein SAMN06264348_101471 [Oceanospirillum linum]
MIFTNNIFKIITSFLLLSVASFSMAANKEDTNVTAQDIRQETADVVETLQAYTEDQQQEAVQTARQVMQRADERINQLEAQIDNRWDQLSKPARKETQAALRELRQERNQLSEWYGSMKESSKGAWSEMRNGFNKAYQSMSDAWQDAQEEYDRGQQDA